MNETQTVISVISGVVLIIISYSIYHINNEIKKLDKELEKLTVIKPKIEKELLEKLIKICSMLKIPITYEKELEKAAGRILYHRDMSGRIILDNARIEILEHRKDSPYLLAHEIGHYIALKSESDDSEECADNKAFELCSTLLSQEEREILATSLRIYFLKDSKEVEYVQ